MVVMVAHHISDLQPPLFLPSILAIIEIWEWNVAISVYMDKLFANSYLEELRQHAV